MCECQKKCQNCCEHKNLEFTKQTNDVFCKDCGKIWKNNIQYIQQPVQYVYNGFPIFYVNNLKYYWNGYTWEILSY